MSDTPGAPFGPRRGPGIAPVLSGPAGRTQTIGQDQGVNLPTIHVCAAFGQGPFLLTYTWTDLTSRVLDYSDSGGRHHLSSRFEAATATITLKSDDAALYPWNTASPYQGGGTPPGNICPGVPIMVTASYQGNTYPLYFGYADAWALKEAGPLYGDIEVTCSDGLKLLSLFELTNTTLYPDLVIADGAIALYRFGEASGTQAYDTTGDNAPATYAGVTLGAPAPIYYDPTTAATLGSASAVITVPVPDSVTGASAPTFELWLSGITSSGTVLTATGGGLGGQLTVSGGAVRFGTDTYGTVNDGGLHHIVLVVTGDAETTVYVDGVSTGSYSGTFYGSVGSTVSIAGGPCTVSNVAFYATELSAAQVLNHYTAGDFFRSTTDSTGTRIAACLTVAGIPAAYQQIAAGYTTQIQADTSTNVGTKALSYIGSIVDTEFGTFYQQQCGTFAGLPGTFVFHPRFWGFNSSTATGLLFSDDPNDPGITWEKDGSLDCRSDDLDTYGTTTVQSNAGTAGTSTTPFQTASNAAVIASAGPRVNDITGLYYTTQAQAQYAAQWAETVEGPSLLRIDTMKVALWTADGSSDTNGANVNAVLGLSYMQTITVRRNGAGAGVPFNQNFVIEGIDHKYSIAGGEPQFMVTLHLSPNEQAFGVFVLNDPQYGQLNAGNKLGL